MHESLIPRLALLQWCTHGPAGFSSSFMFCFFTILCLEKGSMGDIFFFYHPNRTPIWLVLQLWSDVGCTEVTLTSLVPDACPWGGCYVELNRLLVSVKESRTSRCYNSRSLTLSLSLDAACVLTGATRDGSCLWLMHRSERARNIRWVRFCLGWEIGTD